MICFSLWPKLSELSYNNKNFLNDIRRQWVKLSQPKFTGAAFRLHVPFHGQENLQPKATYIKKSKNI